MKTALKSAVVVAVVIAGAGVRLAWAQLAVNGTIPPGGVPVVVIQATRQRMPSRLLRFKFSAPAPQPGGYTVAFCIGPAANPCGLSTSYVVQVPASEERLAVIDSNVFTNNVLVAGQGTSVSVPFAVVME
jgi:hypothetical protein